jgi:hypothetical protein
MEAKTDPLGAAFNVSSAATHRMCRKTTHQFKSAGE